MQIITPQDQVFWYLNKCDIKPLMHDISTDVVIIGGGMAGLCAAQAFQAKGMRVVLVEKNYCGAGASGKSSGFITPNSELSLYDLVRIYGAQQAKGFWELVTSGVHFIRNNIQQYNLDCDYQVQDTLVVANSHRAFKKELQTEHKARQNADYESSLYTNKQLTEIIGSDQYVGGIAYNDSFGINAYNYCRGMKQVLQQFGVAIYEDTPVISITDHSVQTPHATINAQHIIVCADYGTLALNKLTDMLYHVQTFLMLSSPLSDAQVKKIFPHKKYMVWDTDLIYHYYRFTGDNRLMLGGASVLYTYAKHETHNSLFNTKKLAHYFQQKFPDVSITFPYIWPGLIGISKDIFPIAGKDKDMPSIFYIAAVAGLPWAAALGLYSAESIINNNTIFDPYFSPYRHTTLGSITQTILGTPLTFALSNFLRAGSL